MLPSRQHALTPLQSLLARRWRPRWVCQHRQPPAWVSGLRQFSNTIGQQDEKPYYVTTPIFYVNAAPHVGHMYNMILTDVLKRWQMLKGRNSILCTGTDEHGIKMQQAATKKDMDPQALCDQNSEIFKDLAARIGISNDIFIRTTDAKHKQAVEYAWQMLRDRGHIYESKHEGWYSVSDETFYPPSQVQLIIEPATGRKIMSSIETGKEVEWTSERNYHFRMSAFKERLLAWYAKKPQWIVPRSRMEDVIREVEDLGDLSISRPVERLTWGVRVPDDSTQTIYVWLDALLNYASAVGYPFAPGADDASGWPADVHVIGKDIIRFHCIYWPALLMALDLPLPKQILTHAHWTLGKQKMSKSTGNGVNPFFALDRFSLDALRWFLMHDGGIENDADYDNSLVVQKYKKSLQGGIGNLSSRITRGKGWSVRQAVQRFTSTNDRAMLLSGDADALTKQFLSDLQHVPEDVEHHMRELFPNKALRRAMETIYNANAYMQHAAPWAQVSTLKQIAADTTGQELYAFEKQGQTVESLEGEIDKVVYLCAESLRLVGIMLQAYIPDSAKTLLDMLGVSQERRNFDWCVLGKDDSYGTPMIDVGRGTKGVLFPPLINEA